VPDECKAMLENILFMAKYKYDKYELYKAGLRFLSYLVPWLEQFSERERITMVKLVDNLMYISEEEMQSLSSIMFQKICHELLEEIIIAESLDEFDYNTAFSTHFQKYLDESIFVGMSDGSRIGYFRRHSVVLPRDSVLEFYKVDEWEKRQLTKKRFAFLIDDFCGSGTTFIRGEEDKKGKMVPAGQLQRFMERWADFVRFERIFYCPYIITKGAYSRINELVSGSEKIIDIKVGFKILYSMLIPADHSCVFSPSRIFGDSDLERIKRICDKYYDRFKEDKNAKKYGGCRYGFGETGLAIAIYHNTPNNCIYPIWNTTMKWHSLFPRISKHK
jgi:hypothetical protein